MREQVLLCAPPHSAFSAIRRYVFTASSRDRRERALAVGYDWSVNVAAVDAFSTIRVVATRGAPFLRLRDTRSRARGGALTGARIGANAK